MWIVDPFQLGELPLQLDFIELATPLLDDYLRFAVVPEPLHRQTPVAELAVGKTNLRLESHLLPEPVMYLRIAMKYVGIPLTAFPVKGFRIAIIPL